MRPRQPQRAERRRPEQADAGGVAQLAKVDLIAVHLPAVDERSEAQRAVLLGAWHGEKDLGDAGDLAVAAGRVTQLVARAERERSVAAHRTRAAGEEILEERQRLAAVPAGETEVAAQVQGEATSHRPVPLVLVTEPEVL